MKCLQAVEQIRERDDKLALVGFTLRLGDQRGLPAARERISLRRCFAYDFGP
jgi:hypothetical protein